MQGKVVFMQVEVAPWGFLKTGISVAHLSSRKTQKALKRKKSGVREVLAFKMKSAALVGLVKGERSFQFVRSGFISLGLNPSSVTHLICDLENSLNPVSSVEGGYNNAHPDHASDMCEKSVVCGGAAYMSVLFFLMEDE